MKHPFRVALVVVAGLCGAAAVATEHAGGVDEVSGPRKYDLYTDVTELFSFAETDLYCTAAKLSEDGRMAAILARRSRIGNELWLADLQQMRKKLVRRGWARRDFISSVAGFVAGDEDILFVYGPDGVGKGNVHFLHTIPTAGGEPQPFAEEKGFSQFFRCWFPGKRSFLYEREDSAREIGIRELRVFDLDRRKSRKIREGAARHERFCVHPARGKAYRGFYARDEADGSWVLVFSAVSLPAYEEDVILAKRMKEGSYFNLFAVGENNLVCSFQGGPTMQVDISKREWRRLFNGEVLDLTRQGKGILGIANKKGVLVRFLSFAYDPSKGIFPAGLPGGFRDHSRTTDSGGTHLDFRESGDRILNHVKE